MTVPVVYYMTINAIIQTSIILCISCSAISELISMIILSGRISEDVYFSKEEKRLRKENDT